MSEGDPPNRSTYWRLLAGVIARVALVVGAASYDLVRDRAELQRNAAVNAANLSDALGDQITGLIDTADIAVRLLKTSAPLMPNFATG